MNKARLIAKGYLQEAIRCRLPRGFLTCSQIFYSSLLLALAAEIKKEIEHLVVKTGFLNGELLETLYIIGQKDSI